MTVFFKSEKKPSEQEQGKEEKILSLKSHAILETLESLHISAALNLQLPRLSAALCEANPGRHGCWSFYGVGLQFWDTAHGWSMQGRSRLVSPPGGRSHARAAMPPHSVPSQKPPPGPPLWPLASGTLGGDIPG